VAEIWNRKIVMNQLHKFPKNDYYTGMWLAVLGVIILSPDSLNRTSINMWSGVLWYMRSYTYGRKFSPICSLHTINSSI